MPGLQSVVFNTVGAMIVAGAEERRPDEPEDDGVRVHGADPAEDEPLGIPKELRGSHVGRVDKAQQRPDEHPHGGAQEEHLGYLICILYGTHGLTL